MIILGLNHGEINSLSCILKNGKCELSKNEYLNLLLN